MENEFQGKKIAFLASDGVEQVELAAPWNAIKEAGGHPELVSITPGQIQATNQDIHPSDTFPVDTTVPLLLVFSHIVLVSVTIESNSYPERSAAYPPHA